MNISIIRSLACVLAGLCCVTALAASPAIEPEMVRIPAGKISATTCPAGITMCPLHDYAERVVEVAAFELAATEVTFAQYDACVEDGGCATAESGWAYENRPHHPPCVDGTTCQYPHDEGWGRDKRPVMNVSWEDAQLYLKWLNAKTGGNYRLPGFVEWEYAARGGAKTTFPWGPKVGKNNANCDGCGSKSDNLQTAPVASFKPNRFGLYDMVGNVSEWVSDCVPTREKHSATCMAYLYRGGSWQTRAADVDPRGFYKLSGKLRENGVGFRVAR